MSGAAAHEFLTISIEKSEEAVTLLSEKINHRKIASNRAEVERTEIVGNSYCPIYRFITTDMDEAQRRRCYTRLAFIGYYQHEHYSYPHDESLDNNNIKGHKWQFLLSFLERAELGIDECIRDMVPVVVKGIEYYPDFFSSEKDTIKSKFEDFVLMALLDGCFIIELLRKYYGVLPITNDDDRIFARPWMVPTLKTDLLTVGNQLPFIILQHLRDVSKDKTPGEEGVSLADLVHRFFTSLMQGSKRRVNLETANNAKHLLHFFHSHFLPSSSDYLRASSQQQPWPTAELIPCATKLRRVGIKFKPAKEMTNFLEIEFRNGVLKIPPIAFDDSTASILTNCVVHERRHPYCSKHFSAYVIFMDSLINTARDVVLLSDHKIVDNYFGTDEQVAEFFNSLGKIATVDIKNCHLSQQMVEVNLYYRSSWREFQTSFMDTYFSSPWSFLSASAVLIALILTLIQAIYAILSYIRYVTYSKAKNS